MSQYGEALISRLPMHSVLRKKNNSMNKIINNAVGEWMDHYDINEWMKQHFSHTATGKYLDLHGREIGVRRLTGESDDDYRTRIAYKAKGHLSLDYLQIMYGIEIYTGIAASSYTSGTTLLSDNPYLSHDGLYIKCDTATKNSLKKKLVMDANVTWL